MRLRLSVGSEKDSLSGCENVNRYLLTRLVKIKAKIEEGKSANVCLQM